MSISRSPAAESLDASVADQLRQVSTATLTMVLLKRGVRTSWLCGVKPLEAMTGRVVGPAFTIRFVPGREDLSQPESYAKSSSFRDAIEAAPAGSVVVIDGRANTIGATLGDILVARLVKKGVVAAVTDAPVRDSDEIRKLRLPVFSAGSRRHRVASGCLSRATGKSSAAAAWRSVRGTLWFATTTAQS